MINKITKIDKREQLREIIQDISSAKGIRTAPQSKVLVNPSELADAILAWHEREMAEAQELSQLTLDYEVLRKTNVGRAE